MDRKGITTENWIIGIILLTGVFALFFLMVNSVGGNYTNSSIIDSDLQARYDKLNSTTAVSEDILDAVKQKEGLSLLGGLGLTFKATIGVLNTVINSLAILPAITSNIASDFNIPSIVVNMFFIIALAIITMLIVFAVLKAVKGGQEI